MQLAGIILIAFVPVLTYAQTADARPTFDVASIKPSDPTAGFLRWNGGPGTKDPGLFTCENCSLITLLSMAYEVPHYRISAPDWTQNTKFVVSAKVPAGATKEQFLVMMQNMLAVRFKLAVHREQKEMQTYDLVIAKGGPKLRRSADEAPAKDDVAETAPKRPQPTELPKMGKDGYPILPEGYSEVAMEGRQRIMYPGQTMQWFAGRMSSQLGCPVTDLTGLTWKYDFALFWAYGASNDRSAITSDTPPAGADSDPGPTLVEAVQSQLGLKLIPKKETVEIIAVDHVEKVPTEN
jgi:uncharacterized protein (TIGR03435 family)